MIVRVDYHWEPEGVWADSPDVEGFHVAGATIAEVRDLVREGLPFYLEDDAVTIAEQVVDSEPRVDVVWAGFDGIQVSGGGSSAGVFRDAHLTSPPASSTPSRPATSSNQELVDA